MNQRDTQIDQPRIASRRYFIFGIAFGLLLLANASRAEAGPNVIASFEDEKEVASCTKVLDPAGSERGDYSHNIELREGDGEFDFHLALSDPRGLWRVALTETVGGFRGETGFRLR